MHNWITCQLNILLSALCTRSFITLFIKVATPFCTPIHSVENAKWTHSLIINYGSMKLYSVERELLFGKPVPVLPYILVSVNNMQWWKAWPILQLCLGFMDCVLAVHRNKGHIKTICQNILLQIWFHYLIWCYVRLHFSKIANHPGNP